MKVWTQPSDRQNVSATNWNVNPSPFISVVADDFTVGPVSSVTAQQGRSQGFTVPLGVLGNFAGTVSFACVSPGGVTIACSRPVTLSAGASPSAVFSVTPGATAASGNITVTAKRYSVACASDSFDCDECSTTAGRDVQRQSNFDNQSEWIGNFFPGRNGNQRLDRSGDGKYLSR